MLESQPTLHHLAHMKSLVNACISIVLEYGPGVESQTAERWNVLPNHIFCSMVAKLAALQQRRGPIARMRLAWFILIAALRDWRLANPDQSDVSTS